MNNLFKQNSRFAALAEDNFQPQKEKKVLKQNSDLKSDNKEERFNSFKNEISENNSLNSFQGREPRYRLYNEIESNKVRKERLAEENNRKLKEKNEKERLEQESLKLNNFPSLVSIEKETKIKETPQINYLAKIKKDDVSTGNKNDIQDPDLVNLKPGWVLLKRDSKTGNTIIKSHPSTPFPEKSKPEKSDLEIGRDILKALADLHERRTKEYIDTYGEYTWEKMFKRPRWREKEEEYMTDSGDEYDTDDNNQEEYEQDEYVY
jgi:hypothetical protein